MTKKLFFPTLLMLFMVGIANAQRNALVNNPALIKYNVRPIKKVFVPFTSKDIVNVTIPKGMTEAEYLAKLNQAEQSFNGKGYSIRDNQKNVQFAAVRNNMISTPPLQTLSSEPTVAYPTEAALRARAEMMPISTLSYGTAGAEPGSGFCNTMADDVRPSTPRSATYTFAPVDIAKGDVETLWAGVTAKYELKSYSEHLHGLCYKTVTAQAVTDKIKTTNSNFSMYIGALAHAKVLGEDIRLAEASFSLNAPSNASKKLSKNVQLYRIGKAIIDDLVEYDGDSKVIDITDKDVVTHKLADIIIPIAGPISLEQLLPFRVR